MYSGGRDGMGGAGRGRRSEPLFLMCGFLVLPVSCMVRVQMSFHACGNKMANACCPWMLSCFIGIVPLPHFPPLLYWALRYSQRSQQLAMGAGTLLSSLTSELTSEPIN